MAFTYSGDPKDSLLDLCRFTLGDTDENDALLNDAEIQFLIDKHGETDALWYNLFTVAATTFAKDCVIRSLGPQSENATERLKYYKEQADNFKKKVNSAGISLPTYSRPKIFNVGMQNNPPYRV